MIEEPPDTHRVLLAPDGMDYWRRRMHARCNPHHMVDGDRLPVLCPWCEEFDGPSDELCEARRIIAARRSAC